MNMHAIEEAFGEGCNLYKDVLSCESDADNAKLRKAYYRSALKHHPDKNPGNAEAAKKFQAISLTYQILKSSESRQEYDETGVIPSDAIDDDDVEATKQGADAWKSYFDHIFGKVTTSDIDAFASKYKCSDEEKRDVVKNFKSQKGNLVKMLDFVMLSEPRDAKRWVEDFILPAMENGDLDAALKPAMEKSLEKLKKKVEEEDAEVVNSEEERDDDETETEEDEPAPPRKKKTTKTPPKKAKPTQTKSKKKKDDMSALVAAIRNKGRGGGGSENILENLGARYGVKIDDNDPLGDADFAKAQTRMMKGKK